jgi:isopenicillin N synthase-like dioxygenase
MKNFFDLPVTTKSKYEVRRIGRQRGYTPFGKEKAKGTESADLKEFWHVGPELSPDVSSFDRIPVNIWPTEIPAFKTHSMSLWHSLHACGQSILRSIALYLGAPEETFDEMTQGGNTVLRMIRYPEPDGLGDGEWAAAHEDINLITLLVEASAPGLQLQRRDGTWLEIQPIPGQLILDTGDMMQRLTNGLMPATTHRVLASGESCGVRYSLPFFIHPHPDVSLAPLPSCLKEGDSARWPIQTAEEYLSERLRENGVLTVDVDVDWLVGKTIDDDLE